MSAPPRHRPARCGAADAVLTPDMSTGEPQIMPQTIGQGEPRLDFDFNRLAIDFEFNWHGMLRRRGAQRALDHDADQRLAISAAGVNVIMGID